MGRMIFVCRKLLRIRSGHGVLVYNNVTQKATRKVVLDPSECVLIIATMDTKVNEAMYLETCLKEAGGKTVAEVQRMGNEWDAPDIMITERVCS